MSAGSAPGGAGCSVFRAACWYWRNSIPAALLSCRAIRQLAGLSHIVVY